MAHADFEDTLDILRQHKVPTALWHKQCLPPHVAYMTNNSRYAVYLWDDDEFHVEWNRVDSRSTNTSGKLSEAKLVEFIVEHGGYGVMEDVTFVAAKTLYRSPYGLVPIG